MYKYIYFIIEQWFWALIELKFCNSIEKQLTWYILNCKQTRKISIHLVYYYYMWNNNKKSFGFVIAHKWNDSSAKIWLEMCEKWEKPSYFIIGFTVSCISDKRDDHFSFCCCSLIHKIDIDLMDHKSMPFNVITLCLEDSIDKN